MQGDKEESQHCASLLVTQHCGVACCPLIVVSLLLLAETLFDWTRQPLRCSGGWTCFLHISQSPDEHQSKTKQMRLSFQNIWPETISLSNCTKSVIYSNLPVVIQSNSFLFSPRAGFSDVQFIIDGWCRTSLTVCAGQRSSFAAYEFRGGVVYIKSPAVPFVFQLCVWAQK